MTAVLAFKGGPGSGNFGHSGRPGKVGGSGSGNSDDGWTSVPTLHLTAATPMQMQLLAGNITIDDQYNEALSRGVSSKWIGKLDDGTVVLLKPESDGSFRPTAAKSEVATYETAKILGWDDLVTPSAQRSDGRSAQVVQDGKTLLDYNNEKPTIDHSSGSPVLVNAHGALDYRDAAPELRHDLNRILILDAITGNPDRHDNNVLMVERGGKPRLMAIDNDGAFDTVSYFTNDADHVIRRTRMSAMSYNRYEFTKTELEPVVRLSTNDDYKAYLAGNFSPSEASKVMQRVRQLANMYEGAAD